MMTHFKYITALVLFAVSNLLTTAQNTKYQRVLGGNDNDNNYAIDRTLDGGLIMTGYTESFGVGGQDVYLIKTNALGQVEWSKAYGSSGDEAGWSVKATQDSGFVVCGTTDALGEADGYVFKTDKSGNIVWSTTLSGDSIDDFYNIIQSKFGGYYAVGYTYNDSFNSDMFVAKFNPTGGLVWSRKYGSKGNEEAYAIAEDDKGYLAIVGNTTYDSITVGARSNFYNDEDIVVAIVDSFGTLKYMNNYGSIDAELGWDIKLYGKDKYAIAGWTKNLPFGGNDAFIMLIDTNGTYKTAYGFGTVGEERIFDVEIKPDLGFVVSGYIQSPGGDRDVMLLNIDNKGGLNSYAVVGGFDTDGHWPTDAIRTRDGGYNILSSTKSFRSGKGYDFYLLRSNDRLVSGCNEKLEMLNIAQANFTSFSFGHTDYSYYLDKPGFKTTNVNGFDSTLCCQLEARVASDSLKLCEGNSVFIGKETITGYDYSWTAVGSNFTSNIANPMVSPSTTTTYKLVVSSKDKVCKKDSAYIVVQVFNTIKADLVRDTTFCSGDTVTVSAYSGLNGYLWLGKTVQANTQSIRMFATDTVYFTVFDNNGCAYADTLKTFKYNLPTFNLGKDTSICENLPISLKGPANMKSYNWNNGQANTQNLSTNVERKHWLHVIDNNGCYFDDTIQIFTNPFSTFSLGADTSFCQGSFYLIPGPGALGGYIWNGVPNPNQNYSANVAGMYTLTAFNSFKCPFTDTIMITERAAPVFSLGGTANLCFGDTKTLNGPLNMAAYKWSNGPTTRTQDITNSGKYNLKVTDSSGCSYTDTITIVQKFPPVIDLGNDTIICWGDSILLDAGAGYTAYSWNNGKSTRTIYAKNEANYTVQVTDQFGCKGVDSKQVDTMKCSTGSVQLPKGMTVNMYPNPSQGLVHVQYMGNQTADWEIRITNLNGTLVRIDQVTLNNNGDYVIDLSKEPKGMYLIHLMNPQGTAVYKVLLQ